MPRSQFPLLIIFFLFSSGQCQQTESRNFQDDLSNVKDLSAAISSVVGPGVDVMKSLKTMSDLTVALLKVSGPLGALVTAFVKVGFSGKSTEFAAINLLNQTINYRFSAIERKMERSFEKIEKLILSMEYRQHARLLVENLKPIFFEVINPKSNSSFYAWLEFERYCLDTKSSPIYGLRFMREFMKHCSLPTLEAAEKRSKILKILQNAENRILFPNDPESTGKEQYLRTKRVIVERFVALNINHFSAKIKTLQETLENAIGGGYETFWVLNSELKIFLEENGINGENEECFLQSVANFYKNNRNALYEHIKIVKDDLIMMSVIGAICTNFTAGTPERQHDKLKEIETIVNSVSLNLEQWLELSLQTNWPAMMKQYLLEAIPGQSFILPNDYNNTAILLKELADSMGEDRFNHRILLVKAVNLLNGNQSILANCSANDCMTIENFRGVHIFVSRFDFNEDPGRAKRANQWFIENRNNTSQAIRDWGYEANDLVVLLNEIDWALHKKLINGSYYRTLIITRIKIYYESECIFETGIAATDVLGAFPSTNSVNVVINPSWIVKTRCFLFTFFL